MTSTLETLSNYWKWKVTCYIRNSIWCATTNNHISICVSGTEVMRLFVGLLWFPPWTFFHYRVSFVRRKRGRRKRSEEVETQIKRKGVTITTTTTTSLFFLFFFKCVTCCCSVCVHVIQQLHVIHIVRIAVLMQEGSRAIFQARNVTCCIHHSVWCSKIFIAFRMLVNYHDDALICWFVVVPNLNVCYAS